MSRPISADEVREAFLTFFADKGCVRYASASLVPENDPTTLFTVAGMSQFKDMFLGRGSHPFSRATTSQKCIRVNDILNVGRTARHHTFFEMLGHFSFNDYFKSEALRWIWQFYTERVGLDADRLTVSVHRTDDESFRFWRDEMGLSEKRIFHLGDKDNFWPANAPSEGPEGPGGYCSEIFYDLRTNDDPKDDLTSDTGRFVEIGNSVFPQFNVRKPHADGSPNLEQLGRRNVDFGGGLERLCCATQGVVNNFDIDLFQTIIRQVVAVTGQRYETASRDAGQIERNVLLRRIADHVRAISFCVADGAMPGNLGRGYVVRRLIRRATLDIDKLGVEDSRLHEIVPAVVEAMGRAYPEVGKRQDLARETLKAEEQGFRRTLRRGLDLFQRAAERHRGAKVFSGDDAFELVTTHGFPKEIIAELLAEHGLEIDEERYQQRWSGHTAISNTKAVEVFSSSELLAAKPQLGSTPFVGYERLELATEIAFIEVDGKRSDAAPTGAAVRIALKQTPFYGESGGQVGDRGTLRAADGSFTIAIEDTQRDDGLVLHLGRVAQGVAKPGPATATVDAAARGATTRHHSATHLMHSALGKVLGAHVEQQGSKVEPAQLRFDYNHPQAPSRDELAAVERWVNEHVAARRPVLIKELPIERARALGAKAQFGEKYGDRVRVVTMGEDDAPASVEFCGGCHVANTGDIERFRILRDEALSAGIRRLTAVAGGAAAAVEGEALAVAKRCGALLGVADPQPREVDDLARLFKAPAKDVPARVELLVKDIEGLTVRLGATLTAGGGGLVERVELLQAEQKRLRKLEDQRKAQAAGGAIDDVLASGVTVAGITLYARRISGADAKSLRALIDLVRQKAPSHVAVLGAEAEGKALIAVSCSADAIARGAAAGALVGALAKLVGGGGGGKPDVAQAGGKDAAQLDAALAAAPALVAQALGGKATG